MKLLLIFVTVLVGCMAWLSWRERAFHLRLVGVGQEDLHILTKQKLHAPGQE